MNYGLAVQNQRPMVEVHSVDLPHGLLKAAQEASIVGWDIETTGLNWQKD